VFSHLPLYKIPVQKLHGRSRKNDIEKSSSPSLNCGVELSGRELRHASTNSPTNTKSPRPCADNSSSPLVLTPQRRYAIIDDDRERRHRRQQRRNSSSNSKHDNDKQTTNDSAQSQRHEESHFPQPPSPRMQVVATVPKSPPFPWGAPPSSQAKSPSPSLTPSLFSSSKSSSSSSIHNHHRLHP
jgi:hypothetical protein